MKDPGYGKVLSFWALAAVLLVGFGLGATIGGTSGDCICTPAWLDIVVMIVGVGLIFWLGAAFQKNEEWIEERFDEWLKRTADAEEDK